MPGNLKDYIKKSKGLNDGWSSAAVGAGTISDIDVAVNPIKPLPLGLLSQIRQELKESNVPYHVDLVDLSVFIRVNPHAQPAQPAQ